MILPKSQVLKPIIDSCEGLHLSVYVRNDGSIQGLQTSLDEVIGEASAFLRPALTPAEVEEFIDPLHDLKADNRLLERMSGHLGIFRKRDLFRVVKIPVPVQNTCVVANSFHIKPLLRWMQIDREFLLIAIHSDSATLYSGNLSSFRLDDQVSLLETSRQRVSGVARRRIEKENRIVFDLAEWLRGKLVRLPKSARPRLFFAGDESLCQKLAAKLHYSNKSKTVLPSPEDLEPAQLCGEVRRILQSEAKASLEFALTEYQFAEMENRARKNIFQIVKAALKGHVKKLIVADGIFIFGKINYQTGGVSIHPTDMDHEDDDILDDIAQAVLSQGGEVVVASREDIPKGYPALAILKRTPKFHGKLGETSSINLPNYFEHPQTLMQT